MSQIVDGLEYNAPTLGAYNLAAPNLGSYRYNLTPSSKLSGII